MKYESNIGRTECSDECAFIFGFIFFCSPRVGLQPCYIVQLHNCLSESSTWSHIVTKPSFSPRQIWISNNPSQPTWFDWSVERIATAAAGRLLGLLVGLLVGSCDGGVTGSRPQTQDCSLSWWGKLWAKTGAKYISLFVVCCLSVEFWITKLKNLSVFSAPARLLVLNNVLPESVWKVCTLCGAHCGGARGGSGVAARLY